MCEVCSPWQGDVIGVWLKVKLYFGVTMQHSFEIQKYKFLSHVKGPIAPANLWYLWQCLFYVCLIKRKTIFKKRETKINVFSDFCFISFNQRGITKKFSPKY